MSFVVCSPDVARDSEAQSGGHFKRILTALRARVVSLWPLKRNLFLETNKRLEIFSLQLLHITIISIITSNSGENAIAENLCGLRFCHVLLPEFSTNVTSPSL